MNKIYDTTGANGKLITLMDCPEKHTQLNAFAVFQFKLQFNSIT